MQFRFEAFGVTPGLPDKPVGCGDGVEVGLLPIVHWGRGMVSHYSKDLDR